MLNEISKKIHKANKEKGFYEDQEEILEIVKKNAPNQLTFFKQVFFAQRIALIMSEASEALEANRKSRKTAKITEFKRESLNAMTDEDFKTWFEANIKDTEEDEVADTIIRLFDLVGFENIDIDFHIEQKLRYNSLRPKKHGKDY